MADEDEDVHFLIQINYEAHMYTLITEENLVNPEGGALTSLRRAMSWMGLPPPANRTVFVMKPGCITFFWQTNPNTVRHSVLSVGCAFAGVQTERPFVRQSRRHSKFGLAATSMTLDGSLCAYRPYYFPPH
jgi:hypothetical protein